MFLALVDRLRCGRGCSFEGSLDDGTDIVGCDEQFSICGSRFLPEKGPGEGAECSEFICWVSE